MSSSESSTQTLVDRVQTLVSENKRAILLGSAAIIAVGGVAYYASTSRRFGGDGDVEKAEQQTKGKKKSKSGKKARKSVKDPDGPILEERDTKPKVEDEPAAGQTTALKTSSRTHRIHVDEPTLTPQIVASMSLEVISGVNAVWLRSHSPRRNEPLWRQS